MGSIRERGGKLFFDFRYKGVRCRELTALNDTVANRKKLMPILEKIESAIKLGVFNYVDFFPDSPKASLFELNQQEASRRESLAGSVSGRALPLFQDFAEEWYQENEVRWRKSYRKSLRGTLDMHILPTFGDYRLDEIGRGDILKYRSSLGQPNEKGKVLSTVRINHIVTPIKMIMREASDRYGLVNPAANITALRVPQTDVDPFSIDEINLFLKKIRPDYKNYYTVRFFTGLRTAEIDGLQWKYVDFNRRQILIRETLVDYELGTTKTPGSIRDVDMSVPVYEALKRQREVTGDLQYVFCNRKGNPLRHRDVAKRVWYPALKYMGLKRRRPYQTRHTAATLWLASGENPEWIARQMGHTTTKMLFTVYSRYVPNLTRKDGSAFEQLILSRMAGGNDE